MTDSDWQRVEAGWWCHPEYGGLVRESDHRWWYPRDPARTREIARPTRRGEDRPMSECRALLPLYDWRDRVWLILARDMGWRARCLLLMAISGVEQ